MLPMVCKVCDNLSSCKSQCQRVRAELERNSQLGWKRMQDRYVERDLDKYSEQEVKDKWDRTIPIDKVLFDKPLSPRESHVVSLLATGLSRAEIAKKLGITKGSVSKMITRARSKTRYCLQ